MQGNFLSFIAKVWQKMGKAKIPTIKILRENTGILNVIAHFQSYSSDFLRRQQKIMKYPSWFDVYFKDVYPKYSKHWLSTVAHTIDCLCSKILNHGLNHGLLFSLFKFFGWNNILN